MTDETETRYFEPSEMALERDQVGSLSEHVDHICIKT